MLSRELILTLSATKQAELIKKKEISSFELVSLAIEHINSVNRQLNAVVTKRFDLALQEAKEIDKKIQSGFWQNIPVFAGVPITVKECIAVKGMPHSGGLYSRRNIISIQNAPVVERLIQAGAIILGGTNMSELGMWMESRNKVYGLTRNPYNHKRTAGGSSGGEGAIISACGSAFGIGSDIGGSIRMPAFFSGIFGHKPSVGLVPNTGHYPLPSGEAQKFLAIGPLARHATDLYSTLQVIKGPDGKDELCQNFKLTNPEHVDIKKIKFLYSTENDRIPVSQEIKDQVIRAAKYFENLGCEVRPFNDKRLKHSFELWAATLQMSGGPTFSELLGQGKPIHSFSELIKFLRKKSQYTLPAIGLTFLEQVPKRVPSYTQKFLKIRTELRDDLAQIMNSDTVILYPPYSKVAPRHFEPMLRPFDWVYTGIFNALEFPATTIPTGLNNDHLPLGVQAAAAPGCDHLTIAVALELEKAFGGWQPA